MEPLNPSTLIDSEGREIFWRNGTTKYGKFFEAVFEKNAPDEAVLKEIMLPGSTKESTREYYLSLREKIAKCGRGLLMLALYIRSLSSTEPQKAVKFLGKVIGRNVDNEVLEYINKVLYGVSLLPYISAEQTVALEGNTQMKGPITADDVLRSWVIDEKESEKGDSVKALGRSAMVDLLKKFEAGSPVDKDWINANGPAVKWWGENMVFQRRIHTGRYKPGVS
jgi:hypothetical protein